MFTNRLFPMVVVLALVGIAALTIQEAVATTTIVADHSYDSIEYVRTIGHLVSKFEAAHEYDLIEQLRVDRTGNGDKPDGSYDSIELLRIERLANSSSIDSSYNPIEDLRVERKFK